jgi:hypothetical protein
MMQLQYSGMPAALNVPTVLDGLAKRRTVTFTTDALDLHRSVPAAVWREMPDAAPRST